jgi:uncharacterized protein YigA (DUF484 family)
MDVACDNDRLSTKPAACALDLLDAASLEAAVGAVEDSLRHEFQVPLCQPDSRGYTDDRWPLVSSAEAHQAIGGLLSGGKPFAACCAATN